MKNVAKLFALTIFAFCLLQISLPANATHNRAGEITYRLISGLTYEVTITTYTYTLSKADRTQLEIQWGDNTSSIAPRIQQIVLPNYYFRNTYKAQHTFPGPGVYELVVQDPNRNFGVKNIPNSVNVIFSIKSSLVISPLTGSNSTPELLNPPIDKAARGRIFIHNPSAFDKEGDSLSYELTVCTEEDGAPISNFTYPKASDTLYVDAVTGDLVWNTPVDTGIYNVALRIKEYRKGYMIGSVTRDMQINVYESNNHPPVNPVLPDYCVEAGDSVVFNFTVTDPEKDKVYIRGTGGPFQIDDPVHRAAIDSVGSGNGFTTARFRWVTSCNDVRERPYQITVKSSDQNSQLSLNDIDEFFIHVTGPAPMGLSAYPSVNSVRLSWDPYVCSKAIRFEIYRRVNASGFVPDSCETGIPGDAGFVKVGVTSSGSIYNYLDDDNGNGLEQGYQYCYRILAIFPDGSASKASTEICTSLVPGIPALLNCSVTKIDETDGDVFLSWLQPRNLDTIPANGPYKLIISRSPDLWGSAFTAIDSIFTSSLEDTTYTDTPLNTLAFPYSYKVELFNDSAGNWVPVGRPETASTFYPELTGSDNQVELQFIRNVPWINTRYIVYRLNPVTSNFDSIGYTDSDRYINSGLANGITQTYRARSIGHRVFKTFTIPNENYSHQASAIPVDTVPPCAPLLTGASACDSLYNLLEWSFSDKSCSEDVVQYNIYYSPTYNGSPGRIESILNPADTSWRHYPAGGLAGCYQVTAIDSFGNESPRSGLICLDACTFYELPNVFTPNGDNINDIYTSINRNGAVKEVNMRIFNRWGTKVFETRDPDVRWDGKIMGTNKLVSSGVYYYTCDVYENRLTGLEVRNMVGFIHVFCELDSKNASDK
ncbi:MAG: gliding motility-associated C-terminal domain-containing protein [Bacteroidales bacterium]